MAWDLQTLIFGGFVPKLLGMLVPWKESYDKPRQHIKKQRYHFADKRLYSQSYGFSSRHVQIWELDHKKGWTLKNWCFQTVVLGTLETPLDRKEIKPVNPKRNQRWIFIGMTDAKAEAPIFWPPDAKSWLIVKQPDAGKDSGQEKRIIEHETVDNITDPMYMSLVSSGSWWWTGKPGVLQSMWSQRVRHNLVTEQQNLAE